jgi:hypothetical protein
VRLASKLALHACNVPEDMDDSIDSKGDIDNAISMACTIGITFLYTYFYIKKAFKILEANIICRYYYYYFLIMTDERRQI